VFWLAGWLQECLTTGSAEMEAEFSHGGEIHRLRKIAKACDRGGVFHRHGGGSLGIKFQALTCG
jgi:hypothetical protein